MATDLSTSLSSILPTNSESQIDALVSQYKATLNGPVVKVQTKKTTLQNLKDIYSTLKTKLSAFQKLVKNFSVTDSTSKFNNTSVSTTDSDIVTGSASGYPSIGSHSIFVTQLAKADKAISSTFNNNSTGLLSAGKYSFDISVNNTDYHVNVDISENDSNSTILQNIADAINSSGAVENVTASVLSISSDTSRLVLVSKTTGSQYALNLNDTSGDLLQKIGVLRSNNSGNNNQKQSSSSSIRVLAQGDTGGFLYENVSELNAYVKIDGIDIIRNSNTIQNVIPGITLNLKGVQSSSDKEINLTITLDNSKIQSNIEDFIKSYNDIITYLNEKVTTKNGVRGDLAGDSMFSGLRFNLKQIMLSKVKSVADGNPGLLTDLGIVINEDGTLNLQDLTKLNNLLDSSVSKVANIFNSKNGVANQLYSLITPFVSSDGLLNKRTDSTNNQITAADKRIETLQEQIDKKGETMRKEYEKIINIINQLNEQQTMMQSLVTNYNSFNDALSTYYTK